MKPFKPPTVVAQKPSKSQLSDGPRPKKRRLTRHDPSDDDFEAVVPTGVIPGLSKPQSRFSTPVQRAPLLTKAVNTLLPDNGNSDSEAYFSVLWRKMTTKKNKTWDGDGILRAVGYNVSLQDLLGRELGRTTHKGDLLVGSILSLGIREVEIISVITRDDFLAGRPFLGTTKVIPRETTRTSSCTRETSANTPRLQVPYKMNSGNEISRLTPRAASSQAARAGFKTPLLNDTVQKATIQSRTPTARHDPSAPGALVMKKPNAVSAGRQIVDVVVDPIISKTLRDHQRAGVAFLYECVMGLRSQGGEGAILADEMGLGKSLQIIALLWTLLKQNPIYGDPPVIRKALIVCPVTLINNWRKEFRRWLGTERIGVFVVDGDKSKKTRLTDFTMGRSYSVMIVGYERMRLIADELSEMPGGIDIVIADEGHRLKTAQNKSAQAIKQLNTARRIILSGTPIQNDLAEFYTMVDFVNPGLLGKYAAFKRMFETPILKAQQVDASANDLEVGKARSEELASVTCMFVLRRTSEVLSDFLPPKTEYVVFCQPTKTQADVYRTIIGTPAFNAALGNGNMALELINVLKKVCNSPTLLLKRDGKGDEAIKPELIEAVQPSMLKTPGASGKLQVLDSLLHHIRTTTDEKVVLVSNYTSTLDVLQQLVTSLNYNFLRLDGQTPAAKRQDLVDQFNFDGKRSIGRSIAFGGRRDGIFVFLLSAKAGGTGLNLIGASRLILFDLDWNPATDLQAMARIHRDGQKRPCHIYRLLLQGALDEKIFQRQVSKTGLADTIVDGKNGVSGFSRDELRDLFTFDERKTGCLTHSLLCCPCGGKAAPVSSSDETCTPTPGRNDLAMLSSLPDTSIRSRGFTDECEIEAVDMTGDTTIVPPEPKKKPKFTTGAKVDMLAQEANIRLKAGGYKQDSIENPKMVSLMQYKHIDTSFVGSSIGAHTSVWGSVDDEGISEDPFSDAIQDSCLRAVVKEDGRRVGFVMMKTGFVSI